MEKISKIQILLAAGVLALGVLLSSCIFADKMPKNETITVTGTDSQIVKSDVGKISFEIKSRAKTQKEALAILKNQYPTVEKYLKEKGIENINTTRIGGYYNYKNNSNGYSTNEILDYSADRDIEITSNDVQKIKEISTEILNLADEGIDISINNTEYFYSDLNKIKVELLNKAAANAKQRAQSMLSATGSHVNRVKSMRMGVFQITSPNSTDVSDYGINDTSTIDKKVTAVVNVQFSVK